MAITLQVAVSCIIKLLILIVTAVVLGLIPPAYTKGWTAGWMVVLFYTWGGLTLIYCLVSIILHIAASRQSGSENKRTSAHMAEIILSCVAIMGWLMICGTCISIAQWTIIDTGEIFIWLAALTFMVILLLMGASAMFCLEIVQSKIMGDSAVRREKYGSRASLSRAGIVSTNPATNSHAAYNRGYQNQGHMV